MNRPIRQCLLALAAFLVAVSPVAGAEKEATSANGTQAPKIQGKVIVFLEPGCPVSRFHTATLRAHFEAFSPRGITFVGHVPNPTLDQERVDAYKKKFQIPFTVISDARQTKAKELSAVTVPEVFVFDQRNQLVYRGRIDDTYADVGKKRPQARVHDLKNALQALLKGEPIPVARTVAIGCPITYKKS